MKKEGGKRGGGGTCKHDNFKIFGFDCSGCYTYFYTNKTAFVSVLFTKFLMVLLILIVVLTLFTILIVRFFILTNTTS